LPAASRRAAASRSASNRRATARKPESREALVKRTLAEAGKSAPARKSAKVAKSVKQPGAARTAPKGALPKTARSRIGARASKKAASPVQANARTPVSQATAAHAAPKSSRKAPRKAPFWMQALGVRDEHATDQPRIELLLSGPAGASEPALYSRLSVEGLAQMRAGEHVALALVAEHDGALVAHAVFVRLAAVADGADASAVVLASLVVDESLKAQGVDERLLAAGLESARAAGVRLAFALGDVDFLGRFGFSVETGARFDSPFSGALLGLVLDDEWDPELGAVEFPGGE
jgi:putative acetyltransferase